MAVDFQHPQYKDAAEKWHTCADAVSGQWAVHAAGERYLPRLTQQSNDEYKAYKTRATYFNATGRTLDGLIGMVFRKPPMIESAGIDNIISDIDLQDTSVDGLAEKILHQVLVKYRVGVLVEYPVASKVGMTAAQAQSLNLRPYASTYESQTIINWRVEKVNNVMQPTLIVLTETYDKSDDEYEQDWQPQIRVLKLGEFGYFQQIYRKEKDKWVQFEDDIVPLMNNAPLKFIPFYIFGAEDNSFNLHEPVLLDLADLNLAHYRVTADWEHGCHFTGLPMLFLAGVQLETDEAGNSKSVHLGSQTAVVSSNAESHGEYIEFTGQGLGSLEKNLDRKEKQMAAIGARFIEQQKAGVEAEGTIIMRSAGETSVLAGIAHLISGQMSKMLSFMSEWAGNKQDVLYKLNKDYMPAGMTPQLLAEQFKTYLGGGMSYETFFENLQRGEIMPAGRTVEDEKQLIADGSVPANGSE
ncbi:MAG: DUF4055 domain-containing protein [Pseudomonadota bacterium]